jgi:hypothetical protein
MKKRIFSVIAFCVMLVSMLVLSACGGSEEKLPTIDGFEFNSVRIFQVEETFNLEIALTNLNEEAKSFDFSKITLKLSAKKLHHNGTSKKFEIGDELTFTFVIESVRGLEVGKSVEVWLGSQKISTVVVE